MAEERLIDEDKDRKYKIRKNADGEDELIIDSDPTEEDEEFEEMGFEVPEADGDDEETAVMTPEQLAAREKAREEAEAKKREEIAACCAHARALIEEKKFEDAAYVIGNVEELDIDDSMLSALKLRALTCDFTDFSKAEECHVAADKLAGNPFGEFSPFKDALSEQREKLQEKTDELHSENETKKEERRVVFLKKRKVCAIAFVATAVPLLVFAALTIYFGLFMHAKLDGSNITLFIVFVSLAGAFLLATLFTARKFWQSVNFVKLNEKNTSTKLGRELEQTKLQLALVEKIIALTGEAE